MAAPQPQRKPRFFWQGALILLPVLVLATVSAVSLWHDEQSAEQAARNRALKDVQSLGQSLKAGVNAELQRFLGLQNIWLLGLNLASQPYTSGVFPDPKLAADVAKWERDYPGISFADSATIEGRILSDGTQTMPPHYDSVPEPPKWFRDLTPTQLELWEGMRGAAGDKAVKAVYADFLKSGPSDDARRAAQYLTYKPEQFQGGTPALATESGVSFQAVACYQMLAGPKAALSDAALRVLWQEMFEQPSFVTPRLLELAKGLTNSAAASAIEKVYWMNRAWLSQCRANSAMTGMSALPGFTPWRKQWWSQWVDDGKTLAIFTPTTFGNAPGITMSNATGKKGYSVWFVPHAVLAAVFQRVLSQNQYLVPDYAAITLKVNDASFVFPLAVGPSGEKDLLGETSETAGAYMTPDAIAFDLKFYLTSRDQMLSSERGRLKLFGALIMGTLATALAGLVAARRAFYRQLEVADMKSNFVSSVSHELRAPIASVRLMAENLGSGKIAEAARQNEYFHFIVQECRRLSALIENVLDFARIEQGRKQYELEPTDLAAMTRTTVKLMEPYAAEKGVKLELLNGINETLEAVVDGRAIQQALVNLIDNAIKHSAKGQTVDIRNEKAATADSCIRISVEDHGPGIAKAEQEKIFERFYRTGSELRRETQGVGIGLSIVKHIVEAHGGRIVLASEPGHGSRFTIELPVNPTS